MTTPITLSLVGLCAIYLEFFLPGAVAAILGGFLMALGVLAFLFQSHGWLWNLSYFLGSLLLVLIVCRLALWQIRKSKRLCLSEDQAGFTATQFAKELIGKEGRTECDLRPSGYVTIAGRRLQAVAEEGFIPKGTGIQAIGGQGGHLIVKKRRS